MRGEKVEVMKTQHQAATLPRRSQQRSLLALPSIEYTPVTPAQQQSYVKKPIILVTEEEHSLSSRTSLLSQESAGQILPMRRQDAPYIRPTKFIPVLDYFSSNSDKEDITSISIKPKWKPGEEQQQSKWRKVNYEVPPGGGVKQKRRDSLSSLVDKNMQEMNQQFKANISHLSQGLCYNHMERKIQSDLGDYGKDEDKTGPAPTPSPGTIVTTTSGDGSVEDANPLIYFKYDFGYEFGIACPRAQSEPPSQQALQLPGASSRPSSWIEPTSIRKEDDNPIVLPIIHETSKKE